MALFMSGLMSLIITLFNIGLVTNIISLWLQAWGFSFMIALPVVILISPLVGKLTDKLTKN
ncbi:DUF2798 domain-containing protein [Oceanicoccus sp. KOV_DT_Chl]|uniref:DUF2798 domain-containing protein n=1 Tax=Oceanicoccus sp. KOV_DT_Chl TaxID=1904639 RepID=UPI00190E9E74|nr:DUF2798 domain-containing protein [Oceanicoccus sp. KOV_DT_Chl]